MAVNEIFRWPEMLPAGKISDRGKRKLALSAMNVNAENDPFDPVDDGLCLSIQLIP
jgi:hypothetical protein